MNFRVYPNKNETNNNILLIKIFKPGDIKKIWNKSKIISNESLVTVTGRTNKKIHNTIIFDSKLLFRICPYALKQSLRTNPIEVKIVFEGKHPKLDYVYIPKEMVEYLDDALRKEILEVLLVADTAYSGRGGVFYLKDQNISHHPEILQGIKEYLRI